MSEKIKVCVIGAGSSYTPELIEGFIENWDELPVETISLMDIHPSRLEIVGGLAQRMVRSANCPIVMELTGDRQKAIAGSHFVISQIRVGGMAARILDEKIPPQFDVIGQETTGPGGFAKALRTIPVAVQIAQDIEKVAPGAFFLNFTNPAGLITEALHRYSSVKAIGLCNLPIGAEMHISKILGIERDRLRLDWVGLNHLNWVRGAAIDGRDCWKEVFDKEKEAAWERSEEDWEFTEDVLDMLGMIPCGYLRYYYNHPQALAKQRQASQTRGEEVQGIEEQLMKMYADPHLQEKPKLLEKRGGAFYSKAAVSLISAITNDKREIHIVNTRNGSSLPGLSPEAVIETPSVIGADGAHPLPSYPMPPEIRGLVQAVKAYEELAAIAGAEGDRRRALQALVAHPLVPSFSTARGLLEALLEAHRPYLPQFYPQG